MDFSAPNVSRVLAYSQRKIREPPCAVEHFSPDSGQCVKLLHSCLAGLPTSEYYLAYFLSKGQSHSLALRLVAKLGKGQRRVDYEQEL